MIPDITIKDYYLQFIHNAKNDINEYNEKLNSIIYNKEEVYNYLNINKNKIKDIYNINLEDFDIEWNNKRYNTSEYLYNKTIKFIQLIKDDNNKILIIQIIKYCNILRNEYKYNKLISLANKRINIKFNTYRKYVTLYYNKVHKCVLEGDGYKFNYGIGTYVINHWKLDKNKAKNKKRLDYAATNARKKELLAKGIKLYNDNEAAWYAARHIPYDGVDYRIYKTDTDWYEFTFINSNIFKSSNLEYKRTEYVATKYRGMSYTKMADALCNSIEDVYNLQVDIKYKLNILLYKYPTNCLNYIRNAEQCKYKCGAHNS